MKIDCLGSFYDVLFKIQAERRFYYYVYILEISYNRVKVGYSSNIIKRLRYHYDTHFSYSGEYVDRVLLFRFKSLHEAKEWEKKILEFLKGELSYVLNEWITAPFNKVVKVLLNNGFIDEVCSKDIFLNMLLNKFKKNEKFYLSHAKKLFFLEKNSYDHCDKRLIQKWIQELLQDNILSMHPNPEHEKCMYSPRYYYIVN